jgi:hypothetical protein
MKEHVRSIVICTLLWGLVVFQLVGVRRRKSHSVLWFALTLATALTITIDPVYVSLDGIFGGRNLLHLVANVLMAVSMFFLSRAILSGTPRRTSRSIGWASVALAASALTITVFFFLTRAPVSSTAYMLEYGEQLSAAIHSSGLFVYVGTVMGLSSWAILRGLTAISSASVRAGLLISALGCLAVVALSVVIMIMNIAHVFRREDVLRYLLPAYDPLYIAAFVLLFVGLSIPPAARRIGRRRQRARDDAITRGLQPLWERLGQSDSDLWSGVPRDADSTRRLHRRVTEIRDALLRTGLTPRANEKQLLEEADARLRVSDSLD